MSGAGRKLSLWGMFGFLTIGLTGGALTAYGFDVPEWVITWPMIIGAILTAVNLVAIFRALFGMGEY